MRPDVFKMMEKQWFNHPIVEYGEILNDNIYSGLSAIIDELLKILIEIIEPKGMPTDFESIFESPTQNGILNAGDEYYFQLIRSENILNEYNRASEAKKPLTEIIQQIILEFKQPLYFKNGSLVIYSVLMDQIKLQLGEKLAMNENFKTFESWLLISKNIEGNHPIYTSWINCLSIEWVENEKHKILDVPNEIELVELAYIGGFGHSNREIADSYIQMLERSRHLCDFDYIKIATEGMDMLLLNENVLFKEKLLSKIELNDWLSYLDSMHYPNLQNQLLLYIKDFDKFPNLMRLVFQRKDLKTKRSHLILLILENMYEYFDRNLIDLRNYGISEFEAESPAKRTVAAQSHKIKDEWINIFIPITFKDVVTTVLRDSSTGTEMNRSLLLWVSSHNELFVHPDLDTRLAIIGVLNDVYVGCLMEIGINLISLIESIPNDQMNWAALNILEKIFRRSDNNSAVRDLVFESYLGFIKGSNFSFSGHFEVNINTLINQAYYFSNILMAYESPYENWFGLYNRFKVHYNGWLMNRHDIAVLSRESFLLTSGIGLACYYFHESKYDNGLDILSKVATIILKQIRSLATRSIVDYETPLMFLGTTMKNYCLESSQALISDFTNGIDSLELVMIFWQQFIKTANPNIIGHLNLESMLSRINEEFEIVEIRNQRINQNTRFQYFQQVKSQIIKLGSPTSE